MPTLLDDLIVNRVDLVDEGANSAAFIELFKRKEQRMNFSEILSKLKPEHAAIIQEELAKVKNELDTANATISEQNTKLTEANDALAKANGELETLKAKGSEYCECDGEADDDGVCKECGKPKKSASFDETEVLKSMPENVRATYLKMREQKEAAEEQVRKAAEEKAEAEAVAKANTLKSLPVEETVLVDILKNCDKSVVDVLTAAAAAIDSAVLGEVGKSKRGEVGTDAWSEIDAKADEVAKRDNVTKQKAISTVIKENPDLYRKYLDGGAE